MFLLFEQNTNPFLKKTGENSSLMDELKGTREISKLFVCATMLVGANNMNTNKMFHDLFKTGNAFISKKNINSNKRLKLPWTSYLGIVIENVIYHKSLAAVMIRNILPNHKIV